MTLARTPRPKPAAPGFRPVAGKRAFEEIAEQIRAQLSRQSLRVGDRLPAERQLAEQFHVSRNTLREALRSLEIAGLLELKKGATGGAFIKEGGGGAAVAGLADLYHMGAIRPQHLTEARILIGTEVARLACARRTQDDLAALEQNVQAAEAATAAGDVDRRAQINYEFHRLLARAARTPC
jgi:GntR family transcriptional repressor for pyruvate dehydrogenase complex